MSGEQLSFRKSANIERVTDKRKDSLFRLVDTDGSGTIDAQEFAVLYDAIKKDLAEELEKEAALEQEASSARRRFKMLLLFVAVLVSFLAASVAANFAVIFAVVDGAVTTTATSTGLMEVKGSDNIAKMALATQAVPLMVAPVLDLDTLATVKTLQITYAARSTEVQAQLSVVGVRKHNSTFVEFITDVPGETIEALNGLASLVVYPTTSNHLVKAKKYQICAANATCSAFKVSGVDVDTAMDLAKLELEKSGFEEAARRLGPEVESSHCSSGSWDYAECTSASTCGVTSIDEAKIVYWDSYSGTRHVVFFLHGMLGDMWQLWDIWCDSSTSCPGLEEDEFKHLVFVFPSSGNAGGRWIGVPLFPLTYQSQVEALAALMCGNSGWATFTSCTASSTTGGFLNTHSLGGSPPEYLSVGGSSDVMIIGFSDGGGLATYANFVYGHKVTKSVVIDYHGHHDLMDSSPWIVDSGISSTAGDNMAIKIYYACGSNTFSGGGTRGITTAGGASVYFPTEGSLDDTQIIGTPSYGPIPGWSYPGVTFREWSWVHNDGRYMRFAVHGLAGNNADGACNSMVICYQTYSSSACTPNTIHSLVPWFVDYQDDIRDWVSPAPPPPPSPPPTPPVVSPSPPPSPPPVISPSPPSPINPAWWTVCELWPHKWKEAISFARKNRIIIEELKCVTEEICHVAMHDYEAAVEMAHRYNLDPSLIKCLQYKYIFSQSWLDHALERNAVAFKAVASKPISARGRPKSCKEVKEGDFKTCKNLGCVYDEPHCYPGRG